MKKKLSLLLPVAVVAGGLVSCSSTVQDRIQESPAAYNALPVAQRQCVDQGNVCTGMTPEAVRLAWGEPDTVSEGMIDGKPSVRWLYNTGGSGFSFGVGVGGGYSRSSSAYGVGTGVGFPINYIPPNTSYVLFSNGKVVSWMGNGRE